jgi:hypothetical protein
MALISYREFMAARESTAVTRNKTAASFGLAPPNTPDVFGHSTPPPWQVKKLLKIKRVNSPTGEPIPEKPIQEKREMRPDYSFDRLVRKATSASQEIDSDLDKAQKEADRLDKEKAQKEKQIKKDVKPEKKELPHKPDEKEDADQEPDKDQDDDQASPIPVRKPLKPKKPIFDPKKPAFPLVKVKDNKVPRKGDHEKFKEESEWLFLLGNTSFDPRLSS